MKNKFIEIIKKKWLRNMTLTILLFAIIICAYLAIIYGMKQVHISDLDFTKEKIYSISKATEDKLGNLEQDVTISIYNIYAYIEDFAYKYANLNNHIKVEKLETITDKADWKTNYGITDTSSFVVIATESKEKILVHSEYYSDFYTMDYTTYQQVDITEEAMTNAILDVTTTTKPKICFLTGHNLYPQDYFQYLQNSLESEVNEVEYIDILKAGSIPEECKVLVITALAEDITEKEKDTILKYISNGGEVLLLMDPNLNKIKMPNFQKVLDEYGVSISDGFLLEGDSNKMMSGAPSFAISTINTSSQIVKNINMDLNICVMNAGKLTFASDEDLQNKKLTVETLATVSDKALYRTDLSSTSLTKIESDEDAANAIISAMVTKEIDENKVSKLIVFANTAFATNMQIPIDEQYYMYAMDAYNNEDVLLNSISYLTEREDNITIRKTVETATTYDVTELQNRIILAIIFAIPVFIIIFGIVIWQMRRRKK